MSQLIKAYGNYDDFEKKQYFTLIYDLLPSQLSFEAPFEINKKTLEEVLKILCLKTFNFEIVFKNWNTDDSSNADKDLDFPFQYIFKSTSNKCMVSVSAENDTLDIDFLYDCNDTEIENWILKTNTDLRTNFSLSKTPVFKVLVKKHSYFETEDVRTQKTTLDIDTSYNDDFKSVSHQIENSIEKNDSGIILLYGQPGTGKTTYIKSLITKYNKSNFIFIQNEFVSNLLDPDFISFLLKQRNTTIVIEDAEKVVASRENNKESIVSTILQLTDGLFSDYLNIKVICTFNTSLSKVDTALLRKGRMIAMYEFTPLSIEKTNRLLASINENESDQQLTIADIYNQKQQYFTNPEKKKIGF